MASDKEQVWLAEYLKCWNATEAARRAGYAWPNKQGPEKKEKFAAEIQAAIKDRVMSADEVLLRLADQARGIDETLVNINDTGFPTMDYKALRDQGKLHLIKKIEYSVSKDSTWAKVEMYDAQAALVQIGRHHALFTDKVETPQAGVVGLVSLGELADMDDEELSERIAKLQHIRQRLADVEGGTGAAANPAGAAPGTAAAPVHPGSQDGRPPDA